MKKKSITKHLFRIACIAIVYLTFPLLTFSNTYYVDPDASSGGDGSISNPFNKWSDVFFSEGDSCLQKRGTRYYGSIIIDSFSGNANNMLYIGAYGTGDKPEITSRLPLTSSWSGPDTNGVYHVTVNRYVQFFWAGGSGDDWGSVIEQDITFNSDTTSTLDDGKWARGGTGGSTIYYNPTASDPAPGDAGAFFEWSNSDLSALMITNSKYIEIRDLQLTRSTYHGLHIQTGSEYVYAYDLLTDYNGVYGKQGSAGIGNGIQLDGQHIWIYDTESCYNEDHGLTVELINGLPKPSDCNFISCVSHHNGDIGGTIRGSSTGVSQGRFIECTFYENGWDDDYGNCGVSSYYGKGEITRCKIYNNKGAGIQLLTNSTAGKRDILISYNLIYNNNLSQGDESGRHGNTGILLRGSPDSNVKIFNNTIVGYGIHYQDYGIYQVYNDLIDSVTIKNNIIYGHNKYEVKLNGDTTNNIILSANCNNYSEDAAISLNYKDYTMAQWNALPMVEIDYSQNPLFNDMANVDFTLLDTSPAIDLGDNMVWNGIADIIDYDGVEITDSTGMIVAPGGIVDIGAYENERTQNVRSIYTGIYKIEQNKVVICPNPVNEWVTIKLKDESIIESAQLKISDNLGRSIYELEDFKNKTTINMSAFLKGIYIVYITINDKVYKEKLLYQ